MRSSPFTALYDACVLYPAPLRDLLLRLGLTGLFRARWTATIHAEWKRNLLRQRSDLTQAQLDRTSRLMDDAIPDALVTGHEELIEGLRLPDADDRHVLAAAIRCGADVIVTFNLRDFPRAALEHQGIEAQHPDEFVEDLCDLDAALVLESARKHRAALTQPPVEVDHYLATLSQQGLVNTSRFLSGFRAML